MAEHTMNKYQIFQSHLSLFFFFVDIFSPVTPELSCLSKIIAAQCGAIM